MTPERDTHRLGTVDQMGQGTPASTWSAWRRAFDELDLSGWDRVLVVAPHPDDEVLGVGALMAALVSRGADVTVAAVTDGGAAYPLSPTLGPAALARVRVTESDAACATLGVAPPHRLGLPDGAVASHEPELVDHLLTLLRPGTICLATWAGDGHPDHEATGRAAAQACRATAAVLVEYPVWMWHWSSPATRPSRGTACGPSRSPTGSSPANVVPSTTSSARRRPCRTTRRTLRCCLRSSSTGSSGTGRWCCCETRVLP